MSPSAACLTHTWGKELPKTTSPRGYPGNWHRTSPGTHKARVYPTASLSRRRPRQQHSGASGTLLDMDTSCRRFSVGRCIGRGGFGTVYVATMILPNGLQTPVALKILRRDHQLNDGAVRRLRDEGRILARLNHPAILKIYDLVLLDGRLTLVTEYVEGAELNQCWQEEKPPGYRALLQIASAVAGALDAAHQSPGDEGKSLELVHRDVKPSNIRLGRHGQVKLLDFGIATAKAMKREASTASDVVMGSLPYMAPERFVSRQTRAPSDIFSLGCTIFEGLAGTRFFTSNHLRVLSSMALEPAKYEAFFDGRLAALPEVGRDIHHLVRDLLQYEPANRPTAKELLRRCDELADRQDDTSLRRWCQEHTWPEEPGLTGRLEGQMLTEGESDQRPTSPRNAPGNATIEREADTVASTLPLAKEDEMPHTLAEGSLSTGFRSHPIAMIGLLAIGVLVLIALAVTLLFALLGPTFFA